MIGQAGGRKKFSEQYLRNRKVQEVDSWKGY